jgi:hypothetical protein
MSLTPTPPSRRDRTKPAELIGLSAGMALFVGLVVLMSTRQLVLSLIFFGVSFIVALMGLAMLSLAVRPTGEEQLDIDEQDLEQGGRQGH